MTYLVSDILSLLYMGSMSWSEPTLNPILNLVDYSNNTRAIIVWVYFSGRLLL